MRWGIRAIGLTARQKKTSGLGGSRRSKALIKIKAPLREEDERRPYSAEHPLGLNPTKVGEARARRSPPTKARFSLFYL